MIDNQQLIAWKTAAWKDAGMVAGYAARIDDGGGANLIKNLVETRLCRRFVNGKRILDVGVGTGRASRPLAAEGFVVTGVDSSAAMLEKCRELAGSTPIELLQGDVSRLPVPDETFDTVMALNTIAHFPHWQTILQEWKRALRPGGRLVFDVFSLDHDMAVAAALGSDPREALTAFGPKGVSDYYLRITAAELVAACNELGLRIETIAPYGSLFGLGSVNHFLDQTLASGHYFDRLLSWASADERLLECALFFEEELFAHAGSAAAGRFMVAIDNVADAAANERWLERDRRVNSGLAAGFGAAALEMMGRDAAAIRRKLAALLAHEPNLVFIARLLTAATRWKWDLRLEELIDEPYAAQVRNYIVRAKLDDDVVHILKTWHQHPDVAPLLEFHGVPLGATIEYESMTPILDDVLHVFDQFTIPD